MNPKLRLLQRDELFKLKRTYREMDSKYDYNGLFTAAVAQLSDETIIGMCGFELIPHVGPLWVAEPFRGGGIAGNLITTIENELDKKPGTGYYTFPSNDSSKRVMEKLGLEKLPFELWKREFK